MSLRARLVLTVTVVAFLALVAADVVTYGSLHAVLYNQVDSTLENARIAVEQTLTGRPPGSGAQSGRPQGAGQLGFGSYAPMGSSTAPGGQPGPFAGTPQSGTLPTGTALCAESSENGDAPGAFVEVRTDDGKVVDGDECSAYLAGATAYSPRLPTRITGFGTSDGGGEPTTFFTAPSAQRDGPSFQVRASILSGGSLNGDELVLALPLSAEDSTLSRLILIELLVTAGALAVALVVGWWLVHLELAPLRRVESTADAIAAGDLANRVPGEGARTEVGRVARALNAMLSAIERAFSERDATEAQLRASEERMRRFVGDASHELRTPIAAVSAYAELFERRDGHEEDLPRVVRGIKLETTRMARLVEDLLLLARLDEGRPLHTAPVELVDLAAGAIETARTVGPQWPLRLEASDAVEVPGDELQLRQVLDNLLANVRAGAGEALLEVADEGPGITPEQAARVFERLYRADPSRARSTGGGAGLGLAIVQAIAEAHGGSASVISTVGGGATFQIRLPIVAARAHDARLPAGGSNHPPLPDPPAGGPDRPARPDPPEAQPAEAVERL
jgi:two-component system OmpR family sensor kinase